MPAFPPKSKISATYPNPSNALAREGFSELYDAVTGLLGTTGLAADARNALGIGPVISFRNLLINANCGINQRGYVSGAAVGGANTYTLDRWRVVTSGQNASFAAPAPDGTITCPAGGFEQIIEGGVVEGGIYTLSWTGSATATVNGAAVTNGGNTVSLPANTNVAVKFSSGTLLNPQFERGTVPTPFERRHPQIELALCQRYYETGRGAIGGYSAGAGVGFFCALPFKVSKRVTPTLTYAAASSVNVLVYDVREPTPDSLLWYCTSLGAGGLAWTGSWTATAEL